MTDVRATCELRILLVEDCVEDELLISRQLRKGDLAFQLARVDRRTDLEVALCGSEWDLVISDHSLPGFSGLEALELVRKHSTHLPFILVSGMIGEATAVEAIRAGANDYLLKQNLIRLVPAVQRAVRESQEIRKNVEATRALEESRQRLFESELQYRTIVEDQREMIIRFDRSGTLTFSNEAYARANNCRVEDLLGKSCFGRIHPDDVDQARRNISAVSAEHPYTQMQMRVIRDDGSIVWREWHGHGIFDEQDELVACQAVGRDITELIEAQHKLRESEQQYRSIVEDQREMIIRFDRNGLITFSNGAYARAGNRQPDELIGQSCYSRIHPDDRETARSIIAAISYDSPNAFMQTRILRDDGTVEWAEWNGRGLFDENLNLLGYQAVGRNITALRMAETRLREKELQLAHLARVSALGEMVAGISHEINQPLATITNFSSAMAMLLHQENLTSEDFDKLNSWTGRILNQTNRISDIIQRLRRFGRPGSQREQFCIVDAVNEALLVTETRTRYDVDQISVNCPSTLSQVHADRIQIEQVLVNLIRNAVDAMDGLEKGQRRISIDAVESGLFIVVTVRDTGPGIPPDSSNSIFESFVTSRKEGMGIGLAISRSIIEAHGGQIRAITDEPCGQLQFTLPVTESGDNSRG